MSLEFTKLSEVATADSTTGSAKLLVEDGGEVKRLAKVAQEQLPAGYPWDGRTVIEWDGNTEGHYVFADSFVHISDDIASDNDILGASVTAGPVGGQTTLYIDVMLQDVATHELGVYSSSFMGGTQPTVIVAKTDGVEFDGAIIEKAGIYIMNTASVTTFVYGTTTTISESLLPDTCSRTLVVNISESGGVYTADKTCGEIYSAVSGGSDAVAIFQLDGVFLRCRLSLVYPMTGVGFSHTLRSGGDSVVFREIAIAQDDSVTVRTMTMTATQS